MLCYLFPWYASWPVNWLFHLKWENLSNLYLNLWVSCNQGIIFDYEILWRSSFQWFYSTVLEVIWEVIGRFLLLCWWNFGIPILDSQYLKTQSLVCVPHSTSNTSCRRDVHNHTAKSFPPHWEKLNYRCHIMGQSSPLEYQVRL